MPTDIPDFDGVRRSIENPLPAGRAAAAASKPVALSNEDLAALGATNETAPASDTAAAGHNGRLQRIAQRITSLIALLPTSLGTKADAESLSVAHSTEDKALTGPLTETAPASDTASSGINGRLQRIAQRLSTMIALFVAQGSTTSGQSGPLNQGAVSTSAPTYSNGQTSPLSLDTAGALRVTGAGGGTQYTQDVAAAGAPIGTALILVRQDTLSGSTVSADGDNIAARATPKGEQYVKDADLAAALVAANTGTQTNVSIAASATTVLASNSARKGAVIYNDSVQDVYLLFSGSGTVSTTLFSYKLSGGAAYAFADGDYTGRITHIAASASGTLRVTEFAA